MIESSDLRFLLTEESVYSFRLSFESLQLDNSFELEDAAKFNNKIEVAEHLFDWCLAWTGQTAYYQ